MLALIGAVRNLKLVVILLSQGEHLTRGSRLVDFNIRVGDAECVPVSVTDNQVDCRLPANKPGRDINDTFCQDDTLSMKVFRYLYKALLLRFYRVQGTPTHCCHSAETKQNEETVSLMRVRTPHYYRNVFNVEENEALSRNSATASHNS